LFDDNKNQPWLNEQEVKLVGIGLTAEKEIARKSLGAQRRMQSMRVR